MSQETIERTFEVESPAQLKLSNIRGSVAIQAGEDGLIAVVAIKHLDSGNQEKTEIVIEQGENGRVIVKTDYQEQVMNWFGFNKPCNVDYTVRVPANCDLQSSGVSCDISAQNIQGEIDISTVSGRLDLRGLSGQLKFTTVSGAIKAETLTGHLDANAVSGRVRVMESELSAAEIKTVSGEIILQTPLADGPYMFKSVSGKATLIVPKNTGCVAIHKSVSGRLKTSLPITQDKRYGSRGWAEIQGGGTEVTHKSVSGYFRVVTSEDEKIVEQPTPVESPHQPKSQMALLQKIESGELSVEDALKEMNA